MAKRKGPTNKDSRPGRLRIVAGKWRSRLVPIAEHEGLRPTPARVRETLFNWLSTEIHGSDCLDLFAGTGALAFEAVSRGAATATMIEKSAKVANLLHSSSLDLGADNVRIESTDAVSFLSRPADKCYDIVFLDPPFADDLVEECCQLLQSNGWLTDRAAIYIEQGNSQPLPALPAGWHVARNGQTGQVKFALLRTEAQDQHRRTR